MLVGSLPTEPTVGSSVSFVGSPPVELTVGLVVPPEKLLGAEVGEWVFPGAKVSVGSLPAEVTVGPAVP